MNQCSIGEFLSEECNRKVYKSSENIFEISNHEDCLIYSLRTSIPKDKLLKACKYHKCKYYQYYAKEQKHCCDPTNCHTKSVTGKLFEITLEFSENIKNYQLIPGKKICYNCQTKITNEATVNIDEASNDSKYTHDISNKSINDINVELTSATMISPIKSKLNKHQLKHKLHNKADELKTKILKIAIPKIDEQSTDVENDAMLYLDELMEDVKLKFQQTKRL